MVPEDKLFLKSYLKCVIPTSLRLRLAHILKMLIEVRRAYVE